MAKPQITEKKLLKNFWELPLYIFYSVQPHWVSVWAIMYSSLGWNTYLPKQNPFCRKGHKLYILLWICILKNGTFGHSGPFFFWKWPFINIEFWVKRLTYATLIPNNKHITVNWIFWLSNAIFWSFLGWKNYHYQDFETIVYHDIS